MKTTAIISTLLAVALAAPAVPYSKRQGQNFQTFTGALGGIAATPVTDSGNPDREFQVKGDTFVNIGGALQRSCDQQFNACANKANGGDTTISVSACADQKTQCDAAGQGNNGASAVQATATATAAAVAASTSTAAAKNPCDTASAQAEVATSTVAATAAVSSTAAAKNPCDTAAASAGNAKKNHQSSNKNKGDSTKGTSAGVSAANPCDKTAKRFVGNKTKRFVGNKTFIAEPRTITRRFKVA
ncbi:hypothetical protein PMIN01_01735 [Paraphaeosphaeria minitans]|uniref:Uncharacterized protein n=1 Tax=Paraphaeosphaeria minitans TaxID=565426 RepID=A0A9P6GNV5_9PLEO|nr:hypothetical protein PMIN01_01735 [Paraphaeosphaeria minitans]